jgi:CHAT domain-containing protein
MTVVYALGLGHHHPKASASEPARADVVAGSSDLPAVLAEASDVTARLRALGWRVDASWDPASDDQPQLLHYAGHGHHAGEAGWDSYIEIPGFGRLSATQIVAGQRAPSVVVLGACSTGAVRDEIIDGGMNLSAAFLLAGAELVIAPTGPVDDQTALLLSQSIYAGLTSGGASAPECIAALALAQRDQAGAREPGDPTSYARWRAWRP